MAVSCKSILQAGLILVRSTSPIVVAVLAFQLPILVFGTPTDDSPLWSMIKHRQFEEARVSGHYEMEHFGTSPRAFAERSSWERGQRHVRMFIRGLSIDPGATLQDAVFGSLSVLGSAVHELQDSEWGDSVREVAESLREAARGARNR